MNEEEARKWLERDSELHPDMPEEFWPEEVMVIVKNCGNELGCRFKITDRNKILSSLHAMRLAVWMASYHKNDDGSALGN